MRRPHKLSVLFPAILLFATALVSCLPQEGTKVPTTDNTSASITPLAYSSSGKMSLWTNGTQLRGVNIYQRRVFLEVDGPDYMGPGPFGPPYTQDDFNHLAELGVNYVNISTTGLFTVEPPYVVDEQAVANLDHLLGMAAEADLFAVITFRTGPGRSEFAIIGGGDWLPEGYVIETVWTDEIARLAWAEMWHFTAGRYQNNPIVVGYDLMCEPNSNDLVDIWDPQTFYDQYTGTGYDWNSWYPDLVSAIREVDTDTPILVGGNSYSDIDWLPYLQLVDDPRIVYTFHQYSPNEYTNQDAPGLTRSYPGYFDTNNDGNPETFDRTWLEDQLTTAADFQSEHNVALAVNEFGVERWEPGAAEFVGDEMNLFEQHGWNYATWQWFPSWPPLAETENPFNFLLGPDPASRTGEPNALSEAYFAAWRRNTVRPSNYQP